MLRSRGNRLPSERAARCLALLSFSFYRGGRRACRLSLYRSGRAAPVASPSVVFGRPRGLSFYRAPLVPRGPPILLLSLLVIPRVREEKDRVRTRFPSSLSLSLGHILARSSLSSCGFLLRLPRPRVPLVVVGNRRYRCTRTHTRRGALFPQRTAPFFERPAAIPRRFHSDPP